MESRQPTREKILEVARHQFALRGYAGASMRRIAEKLGLTKATLYHYFPDKAALFRETMTHSMHALNERVMAAVDDADGPLERLRALLTAKMHVLTTERDFVRQLHTLFFLPKEAAVSVGDVIEHHHAPVRDALAACAAAGYLDRDEVSDRALALHGALEYLGAIWLLDPTMPRPDEALIDRLLCQQVPRAAKELAALQRRKSSRARPGRPEEARAKPDCPDEARAKASRDVSPGMRRRSLNRGAGAGKARQALGRARGAARAVAVLLLPLASVVLSPAIAAEQIAAVPGADLSLTLSECIDQAVGANAQLEAVRTGRERLAGQMAQARAIGLPSLDLSGTWSRGRDPSFAFDETFGGGGDDQGSSGSVLDSLFGDVSFIPAPEDIAAQTFWRTSLSARWELQPMLVYNAVRAAGAGIERQEVVIDRAENETIEATMLAYHAVVLAAERLAALDADLEAKREFLETTRRRFELGLSTPLDTLRAAVAYANLVPQRRSTEQQLRDAGAQLNVLMGRAPDTGLTILGDVPLETTPLDVELAVAAIDRRPDLRELELYVAILERNRGAIRAEHQPSVSANAAYGYVTTDLNELTDTGHDFWNASVSLTVPLFDGLRTRGRVQEAQAQVREARLQYDQARRQARREVRSLIGDLAAARRNRAAAQLNLTAAEDALRQITMRYELGKAEYLTVLDAQADRFLARSNLIRARNEVLSLTASVKRALGFRPTVSLDELMTTLRREPAQPGDRR